MPLVSDCTSFYRIAVDADRKHRNWEIPAAVADTEPRLRHDEDRPAHLFAIRPGLVVIPKFLSA